MVKVLSRIAFAVYAADATILTLLVHLNVISNVTSLDIAAIVSALAVGFHGAQAVGVMTNGKSGAVVSGGSDVAGSSKAGS